MLPLKNHLARPLAATKVKRQKVKGKTSESRQAGITLFYSSGYVVRAEETRTKDKKMKSCSTEDKNRKPA